MELIPTTKNGSKLAYQGYVYNSKITKNGKRRWVCSNAYLKGCKGSLTTDVPMGNPSNEKPHVSTCFPSAARIEVARFRQQQRETARRNPGVRTQDLLSTGLMNLSNDALVALPQTSSLKRDLQRNKASERPQEPLSIQAINIAFPWDTTGGANPLRFLIYDSGVLAGPDRVIVYAADEPLRHLAQSDTWYLDGNFKSAPKIFTQIYVIRSKLDEGAISNVYAFLPGKQQRHYAEAFSSVQRRMQLAGMPINVRNITVDFEVGAYQAFRNIFGQQVNVNGCLFHLAQSTLRKARELGLGPYIQEGSQHIRQDFRMFAGMIDAMAFVPIGRLPLACQVLQNNIPDPSLQPLLDYFLDTYVRGPIIPNTVPPQRTPPMFPPNIWNVFQRTIDGRCRTNNICEGWNNAFNKLCAAPPHPPFYSAIKAIQKDFVGVKKDLLNSQTGTPLTQVVSHETQKYNRDVKAYCVAYQNNQYQGRMYEYLQSVSHNIRFK